MDTLPFASKSLTEHLLRGVLGFAAIIYALKIGAHQPLLSLALGALALVAFRGCPLCWTTGLFGTLRQVLRHGKRGMV